MIYKLALFGQNLRHSQSRLIHQQFARNAGLAIDYQLIAVDESHFQLKSLDFFSQGGWGANITFPHKQAAIAVCDSLTVAAQRSGAVNTIYRQGGQLIGDNTDGKGFMQDCAQLKIFFTDKTIVILGAGGAARGILAELVQSGAKRIYVVNRDQQKLHSLCTAFPTIIPLSYEASVLPFLVVDIVINATSASVQNIIPEISNMQLFGCICYDLAYNTEHKTAFVQYALENKATQAFDGYGMLVEQARLAFLRWFS